jgi:hypothetical protein
VDGVTSVAPPRVTADVAVTEVVLSASPGSSASDATLVQLRDRLAEVPGADAAGGR